jgi:hypothetical protein
MMYYLYTLDIDFAPPASNFLVELNKNDSSPPKSRREFLLKQMKARSVTAVEPASPHAVYRLADKLNIEDLKQRAKRAIAGGFTVENVSFVQSLDFSRADLFSFRSSTNSSRRSRTTTMRFRKWLSSLLCWTGCVPSFAPFSLAFFLLSSSYWWRNSITPPQPAVKSTAAFEQVIENSSEIEGGPSMLGKLLKALPSVEKQWARRKRREKDAKKNSLQRSEESVPLSQRVGASLSILLLSPLCSQRTPSQTLL